MDLDYILMLEYFMRYFFIPALATATVLFIAATIYERKNRKKSAYAVPAVSPSFMGREKEIRRLVRNIISGQSSAVVGVFDSDRTAILDYLSDPGNRKQLHMAMPPQELVFSLLDVSILEKECEPARFWEFALKPIEDKISQNDEMALSKTYSECKQNNFDAYRLDKLIVQMKQSGWRLVLMLHRFEALLERPNLNASHFYANLRRLASSRHPSPLSLIVSGHISLKQFHEDTKGLNPNGSAYLNFMESGEITLRVLSESEINELLQQSACSFNQDELYFIKEIAGGHPYLLQVAVSLLLEAHENEEKEPIKIARENFYDRMSAMLNNMVRFWSPNTCKAFVTLAKRGDISNFENELDLLEKQGVVIKDDNNAKQINPPVFRELIKNKAEEELCK